MYQLTHKKEKISLNCEQNSKHQGELKTFKLMKEHVFEIVRDIINDRCQKGLRFNSKLIKFQFHFTVTNPYEKGVHTMYHVANVRRCVKNTFF